MYEPGPGVIAKNSLGLIGLITSVGPQLVTFGDVKKMSWTGVQCQDRFGVQLPDGKVVDVKAGAGWSTSNPEVMQGATANLKNLNQWDY